MVNMLGSSFILLLFVTAAAGFSTLSHPWQTRGAKRSPTASKVTIFLEKTKDLALPLAEAKTHHDAEDEVPPVLLNEQSSSPIQALLESYWGPRIVLSVCAAIYSTNFALGSIMNEALPASAVTASRMTLAALALLPFLLKIQPKLLPRAILTGACAALGYVTQSIALVDTDPARVSFLGAATVLWLPLLEGVVDKVPMGWRQAPQTWLAAILCLVGVGILELPGGTTAMTQGIGSGDILALLQAVGFGTGAFLSSKLVREEPDQVLSITSVLIATTAVLSWIWCITEGSTGPLLELLQTDPIHNHLPILLALSWTGVISTSINYVVEIAALGRVPPAEASVLLASEPVWAAIFAAVVIGETLGWNDYVGGGCIVAACLVNALLKPSDLQKILAPKEADDQA